MAESDLRAAAGSLHEWVPANAIKTVELDDNASPSRRAEVLFATVLYHSSSMTTTQHARSVLDDVFRPLAKYATTVDSVTALLLAIHVVLRVPGTDTDTPCESTNERRLLFATEAVRDEVFIPLASHVVSATSCELFLQTLCCLSTNSSCVPVFVTAAVRDRVLIPLVQHATTDLSQNCIFQTIFHFFAAARTQSDAVFGTAVVRDRIFATTALTSGSADSLLQALTMMLQGDTRSQGSGTGECYGSSAQAALFRTQSVRDRIFLPLAPFVPLSAELFLLALLHIVGDTTTPERKGAVLFGTKAVRDRLFVPLSNVVTSPRLAALFFSVLGSIAKDCSFKIFGTKPFCDKVILPLARVGTSPDASIPLTGLLYCNAYDRTGESPRNMHTPEMRDKVFIPLARQVIADQQIAGWLCNTFAAVCGSCAPGHRTVFATPSVRDEIIVPFARVVSEDKIEWVWRSIISVVGNCVRAKELMSTQAVRDEVFCLRAASTTTSKGTNLILNALLVLLDVDLTGRRRSLFATARVRDEVLVPLFERATSFSTIRVFSLVLLAFGDTHLDSGSGDVDVSGDVEAGGDSALEFNVEVIVRLTERATTVGRATNLARLVTFLLDGTEEPS